MSEVPAAILQDITDRLADAADEYDRTGSWPERSMQKLVDAGAWSWAVPEAYEGNRLSPRGLTEAYEAIAAGCMSTALIITQRDGAVDLMAASANGAARERWLPSLARGEAYTTVGISQLTTSKRGGKPQMTARTDCEGYRLNGMMPWVTGAERSDVIVTGGVFEDGRKILVALPTDREGVRVSPPAKLVALNASRTSAVRCEDVRLDPDEVLSGPAEDVLGRRSPAKPLVASTCGMGMARALVRCLEAIPESVRDEFSEPLDPLLVRYEAVRGRLLDTAGRLGDSDYEAPTVEIRVSVNEVVLRLAMTAMTLAKGSGLSLKNPVQRLVREAMFMLVWSASGEVQAGTLARLMGPLSR